jgi:pimeloyl-ACP methyl ester carboxylesterase
MTRFVLVAGFGGAADFDFVAPMLRREHEVVVLEPGSPIDADRDTILVGYGPGAVLAAEHAASHDVAALVLICGWAEPTERLREWARHAGDATFARHTMTGPETERPPLVRRELLGLLDTLPAPTPTAIDAPTLVIGATFDLVATAHQSRLLYGAIADSHHVELPTGHAVLVERPAEVLSLLSAFAAQPSVTPVLLP